jgi:ankyrin repeat protein
MKFPFMAVLFLTTLLLTQTAYGEVNSDLLEALKTGDMAMVEQLLEQGADVNAKDEDDVTPLMMAALMGNTDAVQTLLAKGADMTPSDKFGWTALKYAECAGQDEIVDILEQAGATE